MIQKVGRASVAAATAILGYDVLTNKVWRKSPITRRIVAVGLTGSAVINDSEVELYVNNELVAVFTPTTIGVVVPKRDDILPVNIMVPGGAELTFKVSDAPATNPFELLVLFA